MRSDKELLELLLAWVIKIRPEWFEGMCGCIDMLAYEFKDLDHNKPIISAEEAGRLNALILLHKPDNYSTENKKPYWWFRGVKSYRINFLNKIIKKY